MPRGDGSKFVTSVQLGIGFLFALLVIAFVWRLSADYTEHTLNARQYAEHYAASTPDRVERACRGAEGAAFYECVAEQVAASREDQRSEYDLNAQNQMADWAFWMMAVSAVTMGIAAWALWYVKGTLDETRAMAAQATEGTRAAQSAVDVTDMSAKRQLRAYLGVEKIEPIDAQGMFAARAVFMNNGQTPAYIKSVKTRHWLGPFPTLNPHESGPPLKNTFHLKPIINPGRSGKISFPLIEGEELEKLSSGEDFAYYVYGRIEYADVFDRSLWLTFAYRILWSTRELEDGILPCVQGNDAN